MDNLEEVTSKINYLFKEQDILARELVALGISKERMEFFAKLRELIHEKDSENDQTAANILGWAYEQLANK